MKNALKIVINVLLVENLLIKKNEIKSKTTNNTTTNTIIDTTNNTINETTDEITNETIFKKHNFINIAIIFVYTFIVLYYTKILTNPFVYTSDCRVSFNNYKTKK